MYWVISHTISAVKSETPQNPEAMVRSGFSRFPAMTNWTATICALDC